MGTAWAQAGRSIPAYETTHADYFYGSVSFTRRLIEVEIDDDYDLNTGEVIMETFREINPVDVPPVISPRSLLWQRAP